MKRCFYESSVPYITHNVLEVLLTLLFGMLYHCKVAFSGEVLATCTVYNFLHGWSREQKNEQQNNDPNPKKQCSCRLSGSSENRAFGGVQVWCAFSLLFAGTRWLVPICAPEGLRLCVAECLVERNNPKAKRNTEPPLRVPFGYHNTTAPPWNI